jgi:transposase-like protein
MDYALALTLILAVPYVLALIVFYLMEMDMEKHKAALRLCSKCEQKRVPEGGIDMGRGRWYCAGCYRNYFGRK